MTTSRPKNPTSPSMSIIHWPKDWRPKALPVDDTADMELTWANLVALEPGLQALYEDCLAVTAGDDPHFCANKRWYEELKPRLVALVGWEARRTYRLLRSQGAYDLAYRTCYDVLPPCRDCWCL